MGQNKTDLLPAGFVSAPYCLAIDWIGRNMYLGSVDSSVIQVSGEACWFWQEIK